MSISELQTAVPAGTWQSDPVHSSLSFEVQYMGVATFRGTVTEFGASLVDGRLEGTARMASIEAKDEHLHTHLLSPEFFDVERHPEVSFDGELEPTSEGVEVDGEITIKGITKPAILRGTLSGPVTDPYGNLRHGLRLETTIDRTEFGIDWNADLPNGTKALANEVTLRAELALVEAA